MKLHKWATVDPQYVWRAQVSLKSLAYAKSEYKAYLRTGTLADGLMRAVLKPAELDVVHRAGVAVGVGVEPQDSDVDDLRALWEVMKGGDLTSLRTPMALNPEFGDATDLVQGADADIIANGILIDIKTIKSPAFDLRHFEQLVGYVALQRIAERSDFRKVGVYLSRYGRLLLADADEIYRASRFDAFLLGFRRLAVGMSGGGCVQAVR